MSNSSLTVTQREQSMVQSKVWERYQFNATLPPQAQTLMSELQRDQHMEYLTKGLKQLGSSFSVLDANRPWLCYWILHSMALLGDCVDCELENDAVDFLSRCQDQDGGYGGGPGQMPHLATTYAAVNALITLGGEKALSSIKREKLHGFLLRMKDPSGGFRMHNAGEIDVRACYTAISVASVLNILDKELVKNVGNYIVSCQTYEGGIAGESGSEAHGGYTFCGLATMILINEVDRLDLASLLEYRKKTKLYGYLIFSRVMQKLHEKSCKEGDKLEDWVVFRQGVEFGFQGRTNKLVDGCYSFWQGGVFTLIQRLSSDFGERLKSTAESTQTVGTSSLSDRESDLGSSSTSNEKELSDVGISFIRRHAELGPLFHSVALQQYILWCCQEQEGGFKDKPGKHRDFYHTCYCLSGLSVCQHCMSKDADSSPPPKAMFGPYLNLLEPIHPLYNVELEHYYEAHEYFSE